MDTLYFIHIPKTAGTSFRTAAVKAFGKNRVLMDYGVGAPETSAMIRNQVYGDGDYWPIYEECRKNNIQMVCGHVSSEKYIYGAGAQNTIVFLRDPVQRLYSEYKHFVRIKGYEGTFCEYMNIPGKTNFQHKYMGKVPLRALGFVGVTEQYDDALKIINYRYRLGLKNLTENFSRQSLEEDHTISDENKRLALELNTKDAQIYNNAKYLFNQRKDLFDKGLVYAHARLIQVTKNHVVGWAWWETGIDNPVNINIRVNGEVVEEAEAVRFMEKLCCLSVPRASCVGFKANINGTKGDLVDCEVSSTGQVFPPHPIQIR